MAVDISQLRNIAPNYQALTYADYAAPIMALEKAHYEADDKYNQQILEANSLGLSQEEYDQYLKPTMDSIKSAADDLSKKGIQGSGGMRRLLDLRRQYTSTVTPVKQAQAGRLNAIKMQTEYKAASKNPGTVVFKKDARDIPLEEFIKNPNLMPMDAIDINAMQADYGLKLQQLSKAVLNGDVPLKRLGLPGMYTRDEISGLTPKQLQELMFNQSQDSELGQLLGKIKADTMTAYGLSTDNGWEENVVNQGSTALDSMLPFALGTTKSNIVKDESYFENQRYRHQVAAQNNQARNSQITNYLAGQGAHPDTGLFIDGLDYTDHMHNMALLSGKSLSSSSSSSSSKNDDPEYNYTLRLVPVDNGKDGRLRTAYGSVGSTLQNTITTNLLSWAKEDGAIIYKVDKKGNREMIDNNEESKSTYIDTHFKKVNGSQTWLNPKFDFDDKTNTVAVIVKDNYGKEHYIILPALANNGTIVNKAIAEADAFMKNELTKLDNDYHNGTISAATYKESLNRVNVRATLAAAVNKEAAGYLAGKSTEK